MPDRKKVMRGLESCAGIDVFCGDCPYSVNTCEGDKTCIMDLCSDALVLLKEQDNGIKPIKSTTEQKKFADRIGIAVSDFWCGACHFNLIGCPKFCPNCGKKVKWDD